MTKFEKAKAINEILKKTYPKVETPLTHKSAWQLLVATILSARSRDDTINKVTPQLFKKYPDVEDIANASLTDIKGFIKSTGFYNQKAKNIKASAQMIVSKFQGKVPDNMNDLTSLPGVARKTANVVLGNWFNKNEGFVVDTHVKRLCRKWGLTNETTPEKIEKDLMQLFPQEEWSETSLRIIFWGREYEPSRGDDRQKMLERIHDA